MDTFRRRTKTGKVAIVRKRHKNANLVDFLLPLGVAGLGLSLATAIPRARAGINVVRQSRREVDLAAKSGRNYGEFGYACGSTFIPDKAKCYTDPRTRARLKVPLTKAQVQKVRSRSKGAETCLLYTSDAADE